MALFWFWKIVPRMSVANAARARAAQRGRVGLRVVGRSSIVDASRCTVRLRVSTAACAAATCHVVAALQRTPFAVQIRADEAGCRRSAACTKSSSVAHSRPAPQLDEYVAWPLLMARSEPMADASLPDMRARSRPGTAIAAMMPMIATTISSSMSVKPLVSLHLHSVRLLQIVNDDCL